MSARDKLDEQRAARLAADAATAKDLTRNYGASWARIRGKLNLLLTEIEAAKARGEHIDQAWLVRHGHVETAARTAVVETRTFVDLSKRTIDKAVLAAYQAGAIDAETLIRSTLPPGLPWTPAMPVDETIRVAQALRAGAPLGNLLDELPVHAADAARGTLIEGVALGHGTRRIAADLREAFGGNLVRALRISRTETISAYRRSALARYQSASNVVTEWVWISAQSARTCPACLAMHGSRHPLDEAFASHVSCRCSPAPSTRSWAELGFAGIPETRIDVESGETWFARQPATFQRQVLGPGKHAAYVKGRITLKDLVEPTSSPVWGAGLRERSLRDALAAGPTRGVLTATAGVPGRASRASVLTKAEQQARADAFIAKRQGSVARTAAKVAARQTTRPPARLVAQRRPPVIPAAGADAKAFRSLEQMPEGSDLRVAAHTWQDGPEVYQAGAGTAFRHRGVNVFLEDGAGSTAAEAREHLEARLGKLPSRLRRKVQEVRIHAGASPGDAYYARLGRTAQVIASARANRIAFWGGRRIDEFASTFDHEAAHLLTRTGGPPNPSVWRDAQTMDHARVSPLIRGLEGDLRLTRQPLIGSRSVTTYGGTNIEEDWAESVSLFLHDREHGSIGALSLSDGSTKKARFASLYPARAKILEGILKP